ncbi:MAG: hypothetical protein ACI4I7_03505 [Oscillospiraceae bacterium]
MLVKILSKEECAKCKICCCFDSSDIWEAPVITDDKYDEILKNHIPSQKFRQEQNCRVLDMEKEPDEDLYYCSLLDKSKGCIMGDNKPFDCRIWPFRIMSLNGTQVITLSPVCPVVKTRPLDKLCEVADELAPMIFDEAERNPQIVKPYINGYPILAVKNR